MVAFSRFLRGLGFPLAFLEALFPLNLCFAPDGGSFRLMLIVFPLLSLLLEHIGEDFIMTRLAVFWCMCSLSLAVKGLPRYLSLSLLESPSSLFFRTLSWRVAFLTRSCERVAIVDCCSFLFMLVAGFRITRVRILNFFVCSCF